MKAPPSNTLWHVLGAGSMGSLAAWSLQQAGYIPVRLDQRHSGTLRRQIRFPDGSHASCTLQADSNEPIQRLLLAVKGGDTREALAPLLPRLAGNLTLMRLQNGMGTLDNLVLPPATQIIHLVTTDGAWRDGDQIHVVARNSTLAGDGSAQATPEFNALIPHWPGLEWRADIEFCQWKKLAINALINPLTALYRCKNGELLDQGPRQAHLAKLARELDHALPHWLPEWPGQSQTMAEDVARQTASNTSSMLADVLAGRRTEIEFITGHLLRRASRAGLVLETHAQLMEKITDLH